MSISTGFGILLVFSNKAFPKPENETRVSSSNSEEKES
jgi:hypothetical protein